ncbi:MAG: glycosyltransferase family 4 protein [Cytophagaceae bacterium]|jgi:glycosyltransferase involved in cell wall biosynthesis|nr:glycosyltransferase family 4 protein [Cytophagaceae bacterium]
MRTIGTNRIGYPEIRNFAGLNFKNYRVKKCVDYYKIPSYIQFKLNPKQKLNQYHLNSFNDFGLNGCNGYHFFNTLSFGKKPWITTFETSIPRWGNAVSEKRIEKGLRLIAGSACKKIIAISECTARIQKQFVQSYAPHLYDDIIAKMEVIHPPQQVHFTPPHYDKSHVFTIAGHEFKTKGGIETLNVFDKIIRENSAIRLNIISKMSDLSSSEKSACQAIAARHRDSIQLYTTLPNSKVIEILKNSDVAILASHADTYGYFVLEAQSCGCPVISTDIRAMSEINSNECGWVISLPKNELGHGTVNGKAAHWGYNSAFAEIIEQQLPTIIAEIIENPSMVETKREKAVERIRTFHNPNAVAQKLEQIYDTF